MTNNILEKIAGVTAGAIVGLGAIAPHSAEAALITYDFIVNSSYGNDGREEFQGRFSYDDSTEVVSEWQNIQGETNTRLSYSINSIEFFFNDRLYTEVDALSPISWILYPSLGGNGEGIFGNVLQWEADDFSFSSRWYRTEDVWTDFNDKTTSENQWGSVSFSRVEEEAPTPVPEPSAIAGLTVLGLGCLVRKKVRRYA